MARTKRSRRSSKKDAGVSVTKKGKRSEDEESEGCSTVFEQLGTSAGMCFKRGDNQDEIAVDVPIFQKHLLEAIKSHKNYPKIIEEFVESLQERCESPERFRLSLLPIHISEDSEGSIHGHSQESLMRILLAIDILQVNDNNNCSNHDNSKSKSDNINISSSNKFIIAS
ncbi:Fanconi anemia group D2 protein homolog [Exaiptasia diaphana]|uniref:Uncharacterized protein n=1 Tax=Exaiptasia diaphana TaxID=2652724 RepID=A0A913XLM0_EXADI|nr:Fanconi anemia group D2 protein homolog [Exaiptasia diaphana]